MHLAWSLLARPSGRRRRVPPVRSWPALPPSELDPESSGTARQPATNRKDQDTMFAVINRLQAIPGYSHGTVVSVHRTEIDALIADLKLQSKCSRASSRVKHVPLFVLSLAVPRKRGEHVRMSDLVENRGSDPGRS